MADEPDNLVLRMLQEIRTTLNEHTARFDAHDKRFDTLERMIREWQETTATSLGFAAHANMRIEAMSHDIEDIKDRLSLIESRR